MTYSKEGLAIVWYTAHGAWKPSLGRLVEAHLGLREEPDPRYIEQQIRFICAVEERAGNQIKFNGDKWSLSGVNQCIKRNVHNYEQFLANLLFTKADLSLMSPRETARIARARDQSAYEIISGASDRAAHLDYSPSYSHRHYGPPLQVRVPNRRTLEPPPRQNQGTYVRGLPTNFFHRAVSPHPNHRGDFHLAPLSSYPDQPDYPHPENLNDLNLPPLQNHQGRPVFRPRLYHRYHHAPR